MFIAFTSNGMAKNRRGNMSRRGSFSIKDQRTRGYQGKVASRARKAIGKKSAADAQRKKHLDRLANVPHGQQLADRIPDLGSHMVPHMNLSVHFGSIKGNTVKKSKKSKSKGGNRVSNELPTVDLMAAVSGNSVFSELGAPPSSAAMANWIREDAFYR